MSRIVDISMIYRISEKFEMYEKYEIVKIVEMVYISQILEQTEIFDTSQLCKQISQFFQISKSSLFDLCGRVTINAMIEISEISIYIN